MEAKANPVAKTNVRTQNIPICIYLTKDEKAIIKEKAKTQNLPIGSFILMQSICPEKRNAERFFAKRGIMLKRKKAAERKKRLEAKISALKEF